MKTVVAIFGTSLGKKILMAASGLGLFLFTVGHLVGNLQIFSSDPLTINRYAALLKANAEVLWAVRLGLLALIAIHIVTAIQLSAANAAARPERYLDGKPFKASSASRYMIVSGLILLFFIIYHLLHYTVLFLNDEFHSLVDSEGNHDVYRMMIMGFSNPLVSLFYILSVGMLCFHLSHGIAAMFQSLGLRTKAYTVAIDRFAFYVPILMFIGYASIPAAVMLGIVK